MTTQQESASESSLAEAISEIFGGLILIGPTWRILRLRPTFEDFRRHLARAIAYLFASTAAFAFVYEAVEGRFETLGMTFDCPDNSSAWFTFGCIKRTLNLRLKAHLPEGVAIPVDEGYLLGVFYLVMVFVIAIFVFLSFCLIRRSRTGLRRGYQNEAKSPVPTAVYRRTIAALWLLIRTLRYISCCQLARRCCYFGDRP